MTSNADFSWQALAECARWEHHLIADGPVQGLLLHVVADMPRRSEGGRDAAARICARLTLRNGTIYGVTATCTHASVLDVLLAAGGALAGERYDESFFRERNRAIAAALAAAGHVRATVELVHGASVVPRPVLSAAQLGRLALQALNSGRNATAQAPLAQLPADLADHFSRTCGFDDLAVHAWRATLEADALAYLGSMPAVQGVTLNRLAVYNFLAARGGKCRNRIQAVQVLPWLLPMLTAPAKGEILFEVASIQGAIDDGAPLFDAVARAFAVPTAVVRWLGRRPLPPTWTLDASRLRRLLALLSWLPPERRPQASAAFTALAAIGNALVAPLGFHESDETPALLGRYAPCMTRWLRELTRSGLAATAASRDFAQLSADLADARDFLRALYQSAQEIDQRDQGGAQDQVLAFCAGTTVRRLLALSRQWHAGVVAEGMAPEDGARGWRWPAVLAQPWRHGQRILVELTSSAQLQAEGRAMRHCVASYDAACLHGNRMIVSLRAASGASLSTAELYLQADGPGVCLGQHRGAGNTVPAAECVQALADLLRYLNGADCSEALRGRLDFQRCQADRRRVASLQCAAEEGAFSPVAQRAARRLAEGQHP